MEKVDNDEFYTIKEVAYLLGLSKHYILKLIYDKKISAINTGSRSPYKPKYLIPKSEVQKLLMGKVIDADSSRLERRKIPLIVSGHEIRNHYGSKTGRCPSDIFVHIKTGLDKIIGTELVDAIITLPGQKAHAYICLDKIFTEIPVTRGEMILKSEATFLSFLFTNYVIMNTEGRASRERREELKKELYNYIYRVIHSL